jgi:hypothetical protein
MADSSVILGAAQAWRDEFSTSDMVFPNTLTVLDVSLRRALRWEGSVAPTNASKNCINWLNIFHKYKPGAHRTK